MCLNAEYVTQQRVLIAKSEKTVDDQVIARLNNIRFEFEDSRIDKMATKPSQIIVNLTKSDIGEHLPTRVFLPGMAKNYLLPVL